MTSCPRTDSTSVVKNCACVMPEASKVVAAPAAALLVGTGIYLWWPRGQRGGVVSVRGNPQRRVFWRDLHAVTGLFVGVFIVFLAITGMPWSGVWGGKVNEWANGSNFGYPDGVRVNVPMSGQTLDQIAKTSWSLEQAQIPESTGHGAPISLDDAIARFDALGLHRGYAVSLPQKPEGVFSGSVYPDDLSQQRVVHLDQYSGEALLSAMGLIRLLVSFAVFAIALVVVLDNLGVNVTGLVAGLGVGGIAIGLAAQGIFADLFAALMIIFDRPFRRGGRAGGKQREQGEQARHAPDMVARRRARIRSLNKRYGMSACRGRDFAAASGNRPR